MRAKKPSNASRSQQSPGRQLHMHPWRARLMSCTFRAQAGSCVHTKGEPGSCHARRLQGHITPSRSMRPGHKPGAYDELSVPMLHADESNTMSRVHKCSLVKSTQPRGAMLREQVQKGSWHGPRPDTQLLRPEWLRLRQCMPSPLARVLDRMLQGQAQRKRLLQQRCCQACAQNMCRCSLLVTVQAATWHLAQRPPACKRQLARRSCRQAQHHRAHPNCTIKRHRMKPKHQQEVNQYKHQQSE
jgi:hypothetical protein